MVKKTTYSAPEAELLKVKFEQNILSFNNDNMETIPDDGDENL